MDYPNGPLLTNVWVVSSFVLNHHQCHSEYAWVTLHLCLMPFGLIPGSGIVGVTGDDVSPCAQACGFLGCWSWAMLSCKAFCLPSALLLSPFFLTRTRQLVLESAADFSPTVWGKPHPKDAELEAKRAPGGSVTSQPVLRLPPPPPFMLWEKCRPLPGLALVIQVPLLTAQDNHHHLHTE